MRRKYLAFPQDCCRSDAVDSNRKGFETPAAVNAILLKSQDQVSCKKVRTTRDASSVALYAHQEALSSGIPYDDPGVDEEDDEGAPGDHEGADDEVVHGHGEKVVHEVQVFRETVQDPGRFQEGADHQQNVMLVRVSEARHPSSQTPDIVRVPVFSRVFRRFTPGSTINTPTSFIAPAPH